MENKNFLSIDQFQTTFRSRKVYQFDGNFTIKRLISFGADRNIYLAEDPSSKLYCIKLSLDQDKSDLILNEIQVLMSLQGLMQVPKLISSGLIEGKAYIVTEQLGQNLEQLSSNFRQYFNVTEAKLISKLCFQALRELHKVEIVHGDIKPSNFVTGIQYPIQTIKLIDFETAVKIQGEYRPQLRLTPEFSSKNIQQGGKPQYADDLESLLYTLLFLYKGTLPWNYMQLGDENLKARWILDRKVSCTIRELCADLPGRKAFKKMFTHLQGLQPGQKPDYQLLLGFVDELPQDAEPKIINNHRDFVINFYIESLYQTVETSQGPQLQKGVQSQLIEQMGNR